MGLLHFAMAPYIKSSFFVHTNHKHTVLHLHPIFPLFSPHLLPVHRWRTPFDPHKYLGIIIRIIKTGTCSSLCHRAVRIQQICQTSFDPVFQDKIKQRFLHILLEKTAALTGAHIDTFCNLLGRQFFIIIFLDKA